VARVLIVGCGCRGLELTRALQGAGHVVRGTTRREERRAEIEAAGAEPVVADPYRLATMLDPIYGVSAVCWLMGTAAGTADEVEAVHGPRLRAMLETIVDTHVRGFVYEAAGTVPPTLFEEGRAIAREAAATFEMPVAIVDAPPADAPAWTAAMLAGVDAALAARPAP
jgi:nucleoside-diphosphate-sugar epimerase